MGQYFNEMRLCKIGYYFLIYIFSSFKWNIHQLSNLKQDYNIYPFTPLRNFWI